MYSVELYGRVRLCISPERVKRLASDHTIAQKFRECTFTSASTVLPRPAGRAARLESESRQPVGLAACFLVAGAGFAQDPTRDELKVAC